MLPYVEVGGVTFSLYSLAGNTGFACALLLLWKLISDDDRIPKWSWLPLAAIAVVFGTTASVLWKIVVQGYAHSPENAFGFMQYARGSVWLGGFVGAVLGITVFAVIAQFPLFRIYDVAVPCTALGQAFGRVGCFMAGDGCYGKYTELPWGVSFPNGTVPIDVTVHPTPLYDAFILFSLAGVLYWLVKTGAPTGHATIVYLFIAGGSRFLIEFVRLNPPLYLGLTEAQLLSIWWICVGLLFVLFLRVSRNKPENSWLRTLSTVAFR